MKKLARIIWILLLILLPKAGFMSIVTDKTVEFQGFSATISLQIGCATTGDYPTEESEIAAREEIETNFKNKTGLLIKAYNHYINGSHPFTAYRQYLKNEYDPDSLKMKYFYFLGFTIRLNIKEHFAHIIQEKIQYDFIISQCFKGGVFEPTDEFQQISVDLYDHTYNLENILQYALSNPDKIKELASIEFPEIVDINDRNQINKLTLSLRAKILWAVLHQKRYGKSFFILLEKLPEGYFFEILETAVLMMSDVNKQDRQLIREFLNKYNVIAPFSGQSFFNIYSPLL